MPEIKISLERAETLKSIISVGHELDEEEPGDEYVYEVGEFAIARISEGLQNGDDPVSFEVSREQADTLKSIVEVGSEVDGAEEGDELIWAVGEDVEAQCAAILESAPDRSTP